MNLCSYKTQLHWIYWIGLWKQLQFVLENKMRKNCANMFKLRIHDISWCFHIFDDLGWGSVSRPRVGKALEDVRNLRTSKNCCFTLFLCAPFGWLLCSCCFFNLWNRVFPCWNTTSFRYVSFQWLNIRGTIFDLRSSILKLLFAVLRCHRYSMVLVHGSS